MMAQAIDERFQMQGMTSGVPQPGREEKNAHVDEQTGAGKNSPGNNPYPAHVRTDEEQKGQRGFCNPVFVFLSALGSLFAGMIGLSAAAGQSMSKFYWHIPVLYGDKTTREWPEITGFKSGCAAGGKSLFYGFYDGITGVAMLPYKGARGAGLKGFGIGILHGFGGLIFKPLSGIWAFIGHPISGLYEHILKRKRGRQEQDIATLA